MELRQALESDDVARSAPRRTRCRSPRQARRGVYAEAAAAGAGVGGGGNGERPPATTRSSRRASTRSSTRRRTDLLNEEKAPAAARGRRGEPAEPERADDPSVLGSAADFDNYKKRAARERRSSSRSRTSGWLPELLRSSTISSVRSSRPSEHEEATARRGRSSRPPLARGAAQAVRAPGDRDRRQVRSARARGAALPAVRGGGRPVSTSCRRATSSATASCGPRASSWPRRRAGVMAKTLSTPSAFRRTASHDEIKKAYRKLARQVPPRQGIRATGGEGRFKEVNTNPTSSGHREAQDSTTASARRTARRARGAARQLRFAASTSRPRRPVRRHLGGGGGGAQHASRARLGRRARCRSRSRARCAAPRRRSGRAHDRVPRVRRHGARAGTAPVICPECNGRGVKSESQGLFALSQPCPRCRGNGTVIEQPCPNCRGSGRERRIQRRTR